MKLPAAVAEHGAATIEVVVACVSEAAAGILCFELALAGGGPLPPYEAGAHIDVVIEPGLARSYSLIGPLDDFSRYRIAVALDRNSRGGSRQLHAEVQQGTVLRISRPRNNFRLIADGRRSVLIAGGIGITPLYCMAQCLALRQEPWELHYACRTRAVAGFVPQLETLAARSGGRLHLWCDDECGGPIDVKQLIESAGDEPHFYCCGPSAMLDAFIAATAVLPTERVHFEYFKAPQPEPDQAPLGGFVVELARSGVSVNVPRGCTILDALMMNGIDAPYSCYEGLCGTCECKVIEGVPDHRDRLLTDKARAEGSIIICCSGSRSGRLVLDL